MLLHIIADSPADAVDNHPAQETRGRNGYQFSSNKLVAIAIVREFPATARLSWAVVRLTNDRLICSLPLPPPGDCRRAAPASLQYTTCVEDSGGRRARPGSARVASGRSGLFVSTDGEAPTMYGSATASGSCAGTALGASLALLWRKLAIPGADPMRSRTTGPGRFATKSTIIPYWRIMRHQGQLGREHPPVAGEGKVPALHLGKCDVLAAW